jgi:hypothetical protein
MGPNKPRGRRESRVDRAILALLEHTGIEKAAAASGISAVTLWRWMKQDKFRTRLRVARREAYSQCVGRLQQASSAAVATLLRVMTDQASPAGSRVRAADSVLGHAADAIELDDLSERLSKLGRASEKLTNENEDDPSYRGELAE